MISSSNISLCVEFRDVREQANTRSPHDSALMIGAGAGAPACAGTVANIDARATSVREMPRIPPHVQASARIVNRVK